MIVDWRGWDEILLRENTNTPTGIKQISKKEHVLSTVFKEDSKPPIENTICLSTIYINRTL
jgi:hypothetical protein